MNDGRGRRRGESADLRASLETCLNLMTPSTIDEEKGATVAFKPSLLLLELSLRKMSAISADFKTFSTISEIS